MTNMRDYLLNLSVLTDCFDDEDLFKDKTEFEKGYVVGQKALAQNLLQIMEENC